MTITLKTIFLFLVGCAQPSWKGDGICDDNNNNKECEYDGGDCCGSNVNTTFCNQCQCLEDEGIPEGDHFHSLFNFRGFDSYLCLIFEGSIRHKIMPES